MQINQIWIFGKLTNWASEQRTERSRVPSKECDAWIGSQ